MNSEIEGYLDQLLAIKQDAPGIAGNLSTSQFRWRPAAKRWSIGECFDHLNRAAQQLIRSFDRSIADAQARRLTGDGPFVYPAHERLFVHMMEPPSRLRLRAPRGFVPSPDVMEPAALMERFFALQDEFGHRLRQADGLDLRRVRTRSPVLPWLTYSLGTGFRGFLAHERRHIAQARAVRNDAGFPRS